jgi:hypothetical protein
MPRLRPVPQLRSHSGRRRRRKPSRLLLLFVLVAITLGGASLPGTGAAFIAATASVGNVFTTAAPIVADPTTTIVLPPYQNPDGTTSGEVSGGNGQGSDFAFDIVLDEELTLLGSAVAELRVRGAANGTKRAAVTLSADDVQLATGSSGNQQLGGGWQTLSIPLSPDITTTIPADTTLTVNVSLVRLEMELDGPSIITVDAD